MPGCKRKSHQENRARDDCCSFPHRRFFGENILVHLEGPPEDKGGQKRFIYGGLICSFYDAYPEQKIETRFGDLADDRQPPGF